MFTSLAPWQSNACSWPRDTRKPGLDRSGFQVAAGTDSCGRVWRQCVGSNSPSLSYSTWWLYASIRHGLLILAENLIANDGCIKTWWFEPGSCKMFRQLQWTTCDISLSSKPELRWFHQYVCTTWTAQIEKTIAWLIEWLRQRFSKWCRITFDGVVLS